MFLSLDTVSCPSVVAVPLNVNCEPPLAGMLMVCKSPPDLLNSLMNAGVALELSAPEPSPTCNTTIEFELNEPANAVVDANAVMARNNLRPGNFMENQSAFLMR